MFVLCRGYNVHGALGDGTMTSRAIPSLMLLSFTASSIGTGGYHTCLTNSTGAVYCTGFGWHDQLGNGNPVDQLTVTFAVGLRQPAVSVAGGLYHTCALLADTNVTCW